MQCLDYTNLYRTATLHDPKTQIRLLRATQLEEQYLSYEFIVCGLADVPSYDAISYTWGDPSERGFIRVNNVPISVTENCRYALWQVQNLGSTYIWIDSVCINQQDLQEKGAQVAMMFYIYKSASRVLACIGPPDEVSERLCAALIEFAAIEESDEDEAEGIVGVYRYLYPRTSWLVQKGNTFCKALWQDCEQFSSRPYFSRLWIAQELFAGGPCASVVFGTAGLKWDLVVALYEALKFNLDIGNITQISRLSGLIAEATSGFGSHLQWTTEFLCHDIRDKIYGTLHLFDWQSTESTPLQPDYTKSPYELLVTVAPLMFESPERTVYELADLVQILGITASDPCLQPYLACHGKRSLQTRNVCRQWKVPVYFDVRLDHVEKPSGKGTSCVLQCDKSPECSQFLSNSLRKKLRHGWTCETTADGWRSSAPERRARYDVPMSTEAGDILIFLQIRQIEHSILVRETPNQTMSIVGAAQYVRSWGQSTGKVPFSPPSWQSADVTMEATIEEMISFLVPYDPKFTFKLPKIVAFSTYNGRGLKRQHVKDYKIVNMSG